MPETSAPRHRLLAFGKAVIRIYHGSSMAGVFQPSDSLTVQPTPIEGIRPGDVVAYRLPGSGDESHEIVHRVVAIAPCGLVTQGDNSARADSCLVTRHNLLGKVTHVERDGVIRPVQGGWLGLWRARLFRAGQHLRRLGRGPYHWLRRSGMLRLLWKPVIIQVHVTDSSGPVVKYTCCGKTVARWWPEEGRFECRKPYDLVIVPPDGAV